MSGAINTQAINSGADPVSPPIGRLVVNQKGSGGINGCRLGVQGLNRACIGSQLSAKAAAVVRVLARVRASSFLFKRLSATAVVHVRVTGAAVLGVSRSVKRCPILRKFRKSPSEVLDYDFDFSDWLRGCGDKPATHKVEADEGIAVDSSALIGDVVKVVLSGGEAGRQYRVSVFLNSQSALTKEAAILVKVRK